LEATGHKETWRERGNPERGERRKQQQETEYVGKSRSAVVGVSCESVAIEARYSRVAGREEDGGG